MSRNLFLLSMYEAFDCGILEDECLSYNVLWFSHPGLSELLKGAFQNTSAAWGTFASAFCVVRTFLQLMNSDVFCD